MFHSKLECPVSASDIIGEQRKKIDSEKQGALGQYFTSVEIANFMASLIKKPKKDNLKILDPGAGSGILTAAAVKYIVENYSSVTEISVTLYEIDIELIPELEASINYLEKWVTDKGVKFSFHILNRDFILANSDSLSKPPSEGFDLVISNPPYFKISKSDPRSESCPALIFGQPNIYALFMGVSASLLRENGQFVFITPRSFAAGQYFKALRKHLFSNIQFSRFHQFQMRNQIFSRDKVLQENIISYGVRTYRKNKDIQISISESISDLKNCTSIQIDRDVLINEETDNNLILPSSYEDLKVLNKIKSFTDNLDTLGIKISTGPVVPFRSLNFLSKSEKTNSVPLLWIQHVLPMRVRFPLAPFRKEQWIDNLSESKKILVKNQNCVLMRRFSPKEDFRRLTVAPLSAEKIKSDFIGLENHLNYIYRPDGKMHFDEAVGLAAFLNSKFYDTYFRMINGNTQVSATEIRFSPLPGIELIRKIGKALSATENLSHNQIDILVNEFLDIE